MPGVVRLKARPGLRRPRRIRRRPEQELQVAVVERVLVPYRRQGLIAFCHVPNSAKRSDVEAAWMKRMGRVAGVADLLIWAANRRHLQIELKAPGRENDFSPAQLDWQQTMARLGVIVLSASSVAEVERILVDILGLPPLT